MLTSSNARKRLLTTSSVRCVNPAGTVATPASILLLSIALEKLILATGNWSAGETRVPLLDGSLGSFECKRHAVYEAGDHFILVGDVVRAQFEPRRDPLLYFRGKYRRLHFA